MAKMRDLGFFLWRQATNVVAMDRSASETAVYDFPSRFMQCQFHILRQLSSSSIPGSPGHIRSHSYVCGEWSF